MIFKKFSVAIAVSVMAAIMLVGIALAESTWVSNVFGTTWHDTGAYKAYTYSTSRAPYLEVYMTSWGSCSPTFKGYSKKGNSNIYLTETAVLADVYWTYTSRHWANTPYGDVMFYTSDNGTHSSYCWWFNGTASC